MATPTRYSFTVMGRFAFPLDMLRYDCCWPAGSIDASAIERHRDPQQRNPREDTIVNLVGTRRPTDGRWSSFGWTVRTDSVKGFRI